MGKAKELQRKIDELIREWVDLSAVEKLEFSPFPDALESSYKRVRFLGEDLFIPKEAKWTAIDSNGEVYWYEDKPDISGNDQSESWHPRGGAHGCIGDVDTTHLQWKDTLFKIKSDDSILD